MSSVENSPLDSFAVPPATSEFIFLPTDNFGIMHALIVTPKEGKPTFKVFKPYDVTVVYVGLRNTFKQHPEIIWDVTRIIESGEFISRKGVEKTARQKIKIKEP